MAKNKSTGLSSLINNPLRTIISDPRARMYLESFFSPKNITQKTVGDYFTKKDMESIKKLIQASELMKKMKMVQAAKELGIPIEEINTKKVRDKYPSLFKEQGTGTVDYDTYKQASNLLGGGGKRIQDTLGGFNYRKDTKTGKYKIQDIYDWGQEYSSRGYEGKGGRHVTGEDIGSYVWEGVKRLPELAMKGQIPKAGQNLLELIGNAYGPRERRKTVGEYYGIPKVAALKTPSPEMAYWSRERTHGDKPEPKHETLADILGFRAKPRKIDFNLEVEEIPTPYLED